MQVIPERKVLLVDDEPNILVPLEFLMLQQGYSVRKARNGTDALQILADFNPDIIILDVMMPGQTGFEVAKAIRSNLNHQHVQIVFLTAKGTPEDKMTGYDSGGEVYLTKPFQNDELVQVVAELFEYKI